MQAHLRASSLGDEPTVQCATWLYARDVAASMNATIWEREKATASCSIAACFITSMAHTSCMVPFSVSWNPAAVDLERVVVGGCARPILATNDPDPVAPVRSTSHHSLLFAEGWPNPVHIPRGRQMVHKGSAGVNCDCTTASARSII